MTNAIKKRLLAVIAAGGLICVIGAVLTVLAVTFQYDNAMGHFDSDSGFFVGVLVCLFLGVALSIACRFLFRGIAAPDAPLPKSPLLCIASAAVGSVILFVSVLRIFELLETSEELSVGLLASVIFGLLSCVCFYKTALSGKEKRVSPWDSLLSFAPVIFCAVEVLMYYFERTVAVNSPVKYFSQFIFLSYMLAFCARCAVELGRGASLARYIATLVLGITVGGSLSLASVIMTVFGTECTLFTGETSVLRFVIPVYLFICLLLVFRIKAVPCQRKRKADGKDETEDGENEEAQSTSDTKEN